ncbi:unnamed protein product [Vicia faba]|uniref:B box-type domain-containing protein n=1 Tax=Vicia faba TaxID=3906 RepID=A0AAV1ABL8_VICFA|nr:unnamed protein product [Vicia faba]
MKIQCDVCNKNEASLFCTADEAALCNDCDHRVHHANKLASKHHRLSLHTPSPNQHPLCDICQERRAFVLCKQDRAILCKDCDSSIHSVNELTQKHDSTISQNVAVEEGEEGCGGSSISKYLIETLPGWQVDDFLDSSSVPFAFSKGDELFEENLDSFFPNSNIGIWVPQAPPPSLYSSSQMMMGQSETKKNSNINRSRLRDDGNIFTVPQISPAFSSKRTRYLW